MTKKPDQIKKYEILTDAEHTKTLEDGTVLHRIRSLRDGLNFPPKGSLGGWIESERNLDHEGACWVYNDAAVYGKARITDNARVSGNAQIFGAAWVHGHAKVSGNAKIYGNAWLYHDARASGNAKVYDDAKVYNCAHIYGDAEVFGEATIRSGTEIFGTAKVYSDTKVERSIGNHYDVQLGIGDFSGGTIHTLWDAATAIKNQYKGSKEKAHAALQEAIHGIAIPKDYDNISPGGVVKGITMNGESITKHYGKIGQNAMGRGTGD